MVFIEESDLKIFKVREAKEQEEYILYNMSTHNYNFYSYKRLLDWVEIEVSRVVDLVQFYENELKPQRMTVRSFLKNQIKEEMQIVDTIRYAPGEKRVFSIDDKTYFNSFIEPLTFDRKSFALDKSMSYDEFKEKAPYHHKLFMNLHNHDVEAIKDTLLKIADKIRYPGKKAQDCIVFFPGEAAGKGIFYRYVLQPIFGKYAKKTLMKHLKTDFNGFLEEPLVLALEEGKRDIDLVETLKEAITEGTMLINKKGKNQEERDVYFLTFVFSNHMNPIDLGKRRGSYHLTHSLGKSIEQSQNMGAEICENILSESQYLLNYLHSLDFNHQEALMPFRTKAKDQVNDLNKSPIETFYDYLMSYDTWDQAIGSLTDLNELNNYLIDFTPREKDAVQEKYVAKELYKDAYNQWCIRENLKNNIIRHNKDIVQLWALMTIPEDSHKRINVNYGKFANRKIDFIRVSDIKKHYDEVDNKCQN